ncbi:helix-turn-helix transcriptional regulator [Paradesulfitobacterium aromaticivorans]
MRKNHSCHDENHESNCQPGGKHQRFIQPTLLLSLVEQPSHGYELMERLSRFRFYAGAPDAGAVYRHLRRLENEGFVESHWETGAAGPAKRIYAITQEGITMLHAWAFDMKQRKASIEDFLERYEEIVKKDQE